MTIDRSPPNKPSGDMNRTKRYLLKCCILNLTVKMIMVKSMGKEPTVTKQNEYLLIHHPAGWQAIYRAEGKMDFLGE